MKSLTKFAPYRVSYPKGVPLPTGYMRFVSRDTCIAREEVYISWIIDAGVKGFFLIPNGTSHDAFIEEESFRTQVQQYARLLAKDWKGHLSRYKPKKLALLTASRLLAAAAMNDKGLLAAYDEWLRRLYDFCEFIWSPWAMIYAVEPEVIAALPDEVACIMTPHAANEYLLMMRDLRRLGSGEWLKKYAWMNIYNPHDEPFGADDYCRLKRDVKQQDVADKFIRIKENEKRFGKILAAIADKKLHQRVEMAHMYAYLRTDRIDTWKQAMCSARTFYLLLAKRLGVPLKAATGLTVAEVRAFLATGISSREADVRNRTADGAYYFLTKGKVRVVAHGVDAMLNHLIGENDGVTVQGTVACAGKARGRACIVKGVSDLAKVRSGDIFIANFTFPTYTPAMMKAAAIITNEGGMISHAAIVARELRKPCVVGTGNATETFRDGDMIEVDADNGTVRRIV